jgi:hypothetical protein
MHAKFERVETKFDGVNTKFDGVNARFDAIDRRFDDMRDLWRAELHRVEEVLDARLKHLGDLALARFLKIGFHQLSL